MFSLSQERLVVSHFVPHVNGSHLVLLLMIVLQGRVEDTGLRVISL